MFTQQPNIKFTILDLLIIINYSSSRGRSHEEAAHRNPAVSYQNASIQRAVSPQIRTMNLHLNVLTITVLQLFFYGLT